MARDWDENHESEDEEADWPQEQDRDSDEDEPADTRPCPYCRREVYEQAELCPHCGSFLSAEDASREHSRWIVMGMILAGLAMAGLVIGGAIYWMGR